MPMRKARSKRQSAIFQLKLKGPTFQGSIAVPDLISVCQQLQNAVSRQAEVLEGGQALRPGPKTSKVKGECTLELLGLQKGSTTLRFAFARPQQVLPDALTLGRDVIERIASSVNVIGSDRTADAFHAPVADQGVLDSLRRLGELIEKKPATTIELIVPKHGSRPSIKAVINERVRERIALATVSRPVHQSAEIYGVLEMADFKEGDKRCRIHPLYGSPIFCTFDAEKSDLIYRALRRQVKVVGAATINEHTGKTETIDVKEVHPVDGSQLMKEEFFKGKSLEELAVAQGIQPLGSVRTLAGGWPEDDDVEDALEELYQDREYH